MPEYRKEVVFLKSPGVDLNLPTPEEKEVAQEVARQPNRSLKEIFEEAHKKLALLRRKKAN
jgi:hypothetical protein